MTTRAKSILLGVVIVAALGVIVAASLMGKRDDTGVEVEAAAVERQDIARVVKASGEIDPRVKVNISAHVIGRIEKLFVQEGQQIATGDPILTMEQEGFTASRDDWRARLSQANTEVRQAQVDLENARLQQQRMDRLASEGVISTERRESAELSATSAELRLARARDAVAQARANLTKASDDLAKTTIYAPLAGRLIELNAEEGEVVVSGTMNNPASVIGTIADLSEILAEVDVDETEIVYVATGQRAELIVDALPDEVYPGRVVEVGSSGFQKRAGQEAIFFKVKVLLETPEERLRPGMSVRAEIETAVQTEVPVVPIQSVVQRPVEEGSDQEHAVVFAIEDGVARQRPVTTGISDATRVEIVDGVEAGERVVTGPYRTLRDLDDGDAVRTDDD